MKQVPMTKVEFERVESVLGMNVDNRARQFIGAQTAMHFSSDSLTKLNSLFPFHCLFPICVS